MELTLDRCIEHLRPWAGERMFYDKPWDEADFAKFQNQTGCVIPSQLHELLSRYGPLLTGEKEWMTATWDDGRVTTHYTAGGVATTKDVMLSNFKIFTQESSDPPAFPFPMVFFDNVSGGNAQLLMSGTDEADNRVFLWNNEIASWGEGTNSEGMALCADSLWSYIWNLKTEAEMLSAGYAI